MSELKSAAIFDLDGTLIPNTSAEKTFFFHLLRTGGLSFKNILEMFPAIWRAGGNLHDMIRANKGYIRNTSAEKLQNVARTFFEPQIEKLIFPKMHDVIKKHKAQDDLLLLLTGTLDVIAGCFTRFLSFNGFRAAQLEIRNGKYTGRVMGILPYGIGKLEVLRSLKEEFKFDSNKTVLYANVYSDRFVMNAVEKPIAVNPDQRLRAYAGRLGWEIIETNHLLIKKNLVKT